MPNDSKFWPRQLGHEIPLALRSTSSSIILPECSTISYEITYNSSNESRNIYLFAEAIPRNVRRLIISWLDASSNSKHLRSCRWKFFDRIVDRFIDILANSAWSGCLVIVFCHPLPIYFCSYGGNSILKRVDRLIGTVSIRSTWSMLANRDARELCRNDRMGLVLRNWITSGWGRLRGRRVSKYSHGIRGKTRNGHCVRF